MIVVEDTKGPNGPHPVLAVTGLAREARLAAGPGVATVGAGGNPERLRDLLKGRDGPGCRAVMSIGIAGGLDPNLVPGDVVVATGVVAGGQRIAAHPQVVAALARRLADAPVRVIRADVAGVEAAVLSPHAKALLRAETGAAAVDMESQVAAAFAEAHGLPFCAVRVVCDPADRALPAAIAKALKPDGEPDILAVLAALARRSASVGGLVRLARDSSAAFAALGRCRALLGVGLGVPDLGELLRDVA
ncbi:phosphorylase [Methylobacterium sp. 17Sr1-1]|uniref:phosphorylase n=1 Tax=Methylobacterium sp. 17Sr1-1 TaxID=2202826 RepID=UPI000D6F3F64|nr:phosphorylase [Methylobacterium sp. 17Sr1-1]AWN55143.1 phosphorylase [Methylobacterium sp. 17Sr1-1]